MLKVSEFQVEGLGFSAGCFRGGRVGAALNPNARLGFWSPGSKAPALVQTRLEAGDK